MKRKILIILGIIYLAFIVEFIVYFTSDTDPLLDNTNNRVVNRPETKSTKSPALNLISEPSTLTQPVHRAKTSQAPIPQVKLQSEINTHKSDLIQPTVANAEEPDREMPLANIEVIKQKVYDMQIEYIEDLAALEEIVQTGNADQSGFWAGEWASADDWKRRDDSFELKINKNGTFSFFTEDGIHQLSQAFTFDKEKREFYWEEDYYGKIISHRAKFVTPSTLLIIKTSGIKVNLDIYERATR